MDGHSLQKTVLSLQRPSWLAGSLQPGTTPRELFSPLMECGPSLEVASGQTKYLDTYVTYVTVGRIWQHKREVCRDEELAVFKEFATWVLRRPWV